MSLAAGARIGHYEIVSPIGAGGVGEVYRARDTQPGGMPLSDALPIAKQIADALDAAHEAGIDGLWRFGVRTNP